MGSLLVREAMRQASVYGMLPGASLASGSSSFILKSSVGNTSARSACFWSGGNYGNETRAWSPFVHHMSTSAAQVTEEDSKVTVPEGPKEEKEEKEEKHEVSSYWGVAPKLQHKEDGTPWKWACFTPHETYYADVNIDLHKTHERKSMLDSTAFWIVKSLRIPTDIFFQVCDTSVF